MEDTEELKAVQVKRRYINNIVIDPIQRDIFNHLLDSYEGYPPDKYGVPLKPLKRDSERKNFYTLHITTDPLDNNVVPLVSILTDGKRSFPCNLDSVNMELAAQQIAKQLFKTRTRSRRIYAYGASTGIFHALLRYYAPTWIKMGYVINPIATGTRLKALRIRHKRHNWTLVDAQAATGSEQLSLDSFIERYGSQSDLDDKYMRGFHNALLGYEDLTLKWFNEPLGITLASTAMRAARRSMKASEWKWRPNPLLVAMCRTGGAYRGGYAIGHNWNGHAYKIDMNKAYTSALSLELPQRVSFSNAGDMGEEKPGIYICHISGVGDMPLYLSRWEPSRGEFSVGYWHGGEAYTILPSTEIDGIRALGYQVRASFGYKYLYTMTLKKYVKKIQKILNEYDRGTPEHAVAKQMGVSVYGKFSERNSIVDIAYSQDRPSDLWRPFLTIEGDEVPNLWTAAKKSYRPHQQVDWAAHITGHVRGRLYMEMANTISQGGIIIHADTDGFLTNKKPNIANLNTTNEIGAWRFDLEGDHTSVYSSKGYAYGDEVRTAGAWSMTPELVEMISMGGTVSIHGKTLAAPYEGTAMFHELTRTVRRTA